MRTILFIAVLATAFTLRAQKAERIYQCGERVGDAVVSYAQSTHHEDPTDALNGTHLRVATVRARLVVGVDGNVREVKVTETEFRVADGKGVRVIGKSDPAWNDAEIERVTKKMADAFNQWRFTPATLRGEPVAVYMPAELNVSHIESPGLH